MNPLFSQVSITLLESITFTDAIYAFDFDGTLSKIEKTPAEAALTGETRALLKKLQEFAAVAIISGRNVEDLKKRIALDGVRFIGNHGLDGVGENKDALMEAKRNCEKWKSVLSTLKLGESIEIEDNTYSLALHYRRAPNHDEAKAVLLETMTTLDPVPSLILGKCVVNLLPLGPYHKGAALLDLMKEIGATHALYVGDDETDEAVFSLSDPKIMSIRVGDTKQSNARFFIERQEDVNLILEHIIKFYENNRRKAQEKEREGT